MNSSFTLDIFNRTNSAGFFFYGYYQLSPGVYFNGGDFTISLWARFEAVSGYPKLIDFGNGPSSDNIVMSLSPKKKVICQVFRGPLNNQLTKQAWL